MHSVNISTKKVSSAADLSSALDLRWEGYKKYGFSRDEVYDEFDKLDATRIFIAYDNNGKVYGTLRVVLRGPLGIEAEKYLDLNTCQMGSCKNIAEASRFSVIPGENAKRTKLLLWKTAFLYCQTQNVDTIVVWVRKGAVRDYAQLLYQSTGESGQFLHSGFNNKPHQLMYCNLSSVKEQYAKEKHQLYDFVFNQTHEQIQVA